jgi:microcompartment protein CcmK/EutM
MKIARVVKTVVSTIHNPFFDGKKLLLCDYLDVDAKPTGKYVIAVDTVDAGAGEVVLILDEGGSARLMLASADGPVRAVVAGIVDQLAIEGDLVALDGDVS